MADARSTNAPRRRKSTLPFSEIEGKPRKPKVFKSTQPARKTTSVPPRRRSHLVQSKSTSPASVSAPLPDDILTELNDDCLIRVFEFLDLTDLEQMCEVDQRFHEIIMTHVIPLRTINFTAVKGKYTVRRLFELFGKSMARIVVQSAGIYFDEFLKLLVKYCEPGRLRVVYLKFDDDGSSIPEDLLEKIGPYFANVHRFQFDLTEFPMASKTFNAFMTAIDKRNLISLHVLNCGSIERWLTPDALPNLRKFHMSLHRPRFSAKNEQRLIEFISKKRVPLTEFNCIGVPSGAIAMELSRCMPKIECLGEIRYSSLGEDENNNNNNNNNHQENWAYFDAFTNLKSVSLKSSTANFSDSGAVFKYLAEHNTVEELHLKFGLDTALKGNSIKASDLQRLTQLKSLHLHDFDDKRCNQFVKKLLNNLPALTQCTIHGKRPLQAHLIDFIQLARHLKVLKLDCPFRTISLQFYKKMVKCRTASHGQENPLVVVIDIEKTILRDSMQLLGQRYQPSVVVLQPI